MRGKSSDVRRPVSTFTEQAKQIDIFEAAGARGKTDVRRLKELVEAGHDINSTNWATCTPLHCAAPENSPEAVKYLLEHGADVNRATEYGLTPLHFASYYGRVDNVRHLLAWGADVTRRTRDGLTPKDKAIEGQQSAPGRTPANKYTQVISLLSQQEHHTEDVVTQQPSRIRPPPRTTSPAEVTPPATAATTPTGKAPLAPTPTHTPAAKQHNASPPTTQADIGGSSGVTFTDRNFQAFIGQLENVITTHRETQRSLVGDPSRKRREEDFRRMLKEVGNLVGVFQNDAQARADRQSDSVAAGAATPAPSSTPPTTATPTHMAAPAATTPTPSGYYYDQKDGAWKATPDHKKVKVMQSPTPTSMHGYATMPGSNLVTRPTSSRSSAPQAGANAVVLYDEQTHGGRGSPSFDNYTQQWQQYLESMHPGQRTTVSYYDYYNASGPRHHHSQGGSSSSHKMYTTSAGSSRQATPAGNPQSGTGGGGSKAGTAQQRSHSSAPAFPSHTTHGHGGGGGSHAASHTPTNSSPKTSHQQATQPSSSQYGSRWGSGHGHPSQHSGYNGNPYSTFGYSGYGGGMGYTSAAAFHAPTHTVRYY